MSTSLQKKTSKILVNLIIGIIVIAFVISGMYSMEGGSAAGSIAKVGDYTVKLSEFEREVQRQSQFMSNFLNGGKPLSSQQMKQFGVRKNAVQNLVNSKLMITFADDLGIYASKDEIKKTIKEMKYFDTNGQFDINKYKALLSYNRLTPEDFEKDIANQIKTTKAQAILAKIPVSKAYTQEIKTIKKKALSAEVVVISKDAVKKTLPVSEKEISDFLKEEINSKRVESLFKERKSTLDIKEQVKAAHILIKIENGDEKKALAKINDIAKKLTRANFRAMAAKHSQEPGADKIGGTLGWFSKGRMVPEFEKKAFSMKKNEISSPIKTQFGYHIILVEDKKEAKEAVLSEHQSKLTTELIQQEKDITKTMDSIRDEVKSNLESGKSLDELTKKYSLSVNKVELNRLDGNKNAQSLTAANINEIFKSGLEQNKVYSFSGASDISVVKASKSTAKVTNSDPAADLQRILGRVLQENIVKEQKEKVSVKMNGNVSFQ